MSVDPMLGHEHEIVADAESENDRDLYAGVLTEPIEGYEDEENACLHITTPHKTIELGINEWDAAMLMALMDALHEAITGDPVNRSWLDHMRKHYAVDTVDCPLCEGEDKPAKKALEADEDE